MDEKDKIIEHCFEILWRVYADMSFYDFNENEFFMFVEFLRDEKLDKKMVKRVKKKIEKEYQGFDWLIAR